MGKFKHMVDQITPEVYAGIAIALYRNGFTTDDITEIFAESQRIWIDNTNRHKNMIKACEEETGLTLSI